MTKENSELERLQTEFSRLKDELAKKDSELKRIESEMDEERRAVMFMLEDANNSVENMERSLEKLKEEKEITTNLLIIADATAHTTDIDKLMEQVVHYGHDIMKCDVCLSYLYDEKDKVFKPSQCYGLSHEMMPIFRTEPLDDKTEFVKKAMEGKEPMVISEFGMRNSEFKKDDFTLRTSHSAFSWFPDIKTMLVIPLIGKKDYLGIIIALNKVSRVFTEKDNNIMAGIANQVSSALEQARLYKESMDRTIELSRKIETINIMNEIDRTILSTMNSQEVLDSVSMMVLRIMPCDKVTIAYVDYEKGGFRYATEVGAKVMEELDFARFGETSAARIVETGFPEYIANLKEVKSLLLIERKMLEGGFLSHIRVPINVKREIIGILAVGSKRPSAFTSEDLSTLEKLAAQVGVALENTRLVTDLNDLFTGTVRALSSAIDAKSKWTAGHSERVTKYALKIAKEMGIDDATLRDIELSGFLHDIGKIGTYEAILDKPGRLTDEELKIMRQHPARGAEILAPIKQLKNIIPGVKYHHEFYDGTGYPDGLKGDAIPLMARILAVADTVDAMAADRPYRKGRPLDAIIIEVRRCLGTQFDPKAAEAFLKAAVADSEFLNKKPLE